MEFPRTPTAYRADIDGLRALAVVPVILFHCGVPGFSGGFVGVDIFFVISGFLITSILAREIDQSRFSVIAFYERRVRRIIPALVAVLAVTAIAMPFFLLPNDLKDFGRSLFATLAFSSNVYFYIRGDYFDTAAEFMPLLHTWSLAVEEQYYIVFPLLLALLKRRSRAVMLTVLGILWAVSFAVSIQQTHLEPRAAFYLPMGRVWELLTGSLLALLPVSARGRLSTPAFGWAGIALIAASVAWFDEDMGFPGPAALLPCVGAALVLGCGNGSAARCLSVAPLRLIGLISYSLYLWHWPLLAAHRYLFGPQLSPLAICVIIATTVVAAGLSWRYVEAPWRRRPVFWTRWRVFLTAGSVGALLAGLGLFLARHNGVDRFSEPVRTLALGSLDVNPMREACDRPSLERVRTLRLCSIGDLRVDPTFVVLGDSIADALVPAVDAAAREAHRRGLVMTFSGCSPLFETAIGNEHCREYYSEVTSRLRSTPTIRDVIVIARWATILEGRRYGERESDERFLSDRYTREPSYDENRLVFARAMDRMAVLLQGKHVSIVAHVPEQPVNVPRTLAMEAMRGEPLSTGVSREDFDARQAGTRRLLRAASERNGFNLIDLGAVACNSRECPLIDASGRPLFADDNHPSRTAALTWHQVLRSAFAER